MLGALRPSYSHETSFCFSGTATANIIRTLHAIPDGQLQTAMQSPQLRHSTLASLLEADEGGVQVSLPEHSEELEGISTMEYNCL